MRGTRVILFRQVRDREVRFEWHPLWAWAYVYTSEHSPTGEMRCNGWWNTLDDAVAAATKDITDGNW